MWTVPLVVVACQGEPTEVVESPAVVQLAATTLSPTRTLARAASSYLIDYGDWTGDAIEKGWQHDLVVVDPNDAGVTRSVIQANASSVRSIVASGSA